MICFFERRLKRCPANFVVFRSWVNPFVWLHSAAPAKHCEHKSICCNRERGLAPVLRIFGMAGGPTLIDLLDAAGDRSRLTIAYFDPIDGHDRHARPGRRREERLLSPSGLL